MIGAAPLSVTAATLVAAEVAAASTVATGFTAFHRAEAAMLDPIQRRSDALVAGLIAERSSAVALIAQTRSRTRDEARRKALLVATLVLDDAPDLSAVAALAVSIASDLDSV